MKAAQKGSIAGSDASAGLEDSHWLCAIEDRRRLESQGEGMLEGFSLGSYLLLYAFLSLSIFDRIAGIGRAV